MRAKNILRYNYKKQAFQGWRLAISRNGEKFVKYFADSRYNDYREAFRAAVEARNEILKELNKPGAVPAIVFAAAKEWLQDEGEES